MFSYRLWRVGALASAMLAAPLATAKGPSVQERLDAFLDAASRDREEFDWDGSPAIRNRYPAPALTLKSKDGAAVTARPGQRVVATFEGALLAGSFLSFTCEALEQVRFTPTAGGLRATAKVGAFALPERCALLAVSPVSGLRQSLDAIQVVGRHAWMVRLDDGTRTRWTTEAGPEGMPTGSAAWAGPAGAQERTLRFTKQETGWQVDALADPSGADAGGAGCTRLTLKTRVGFVEGQARPCEGGAPATVSGTVTLLR